MTQRVTARQKFNIGQRVTLSGMGVSRNLNVRSSRRATVVGFGIKEPETVWLIKDGTQTRVAYHMSFWDVEGEKQW